MPSWWFMKTVTKPPPMMPKASATMVRKKSMEMQAKMRGVTSLRMGSTPRARMASICSVTTIEPSSLAMEQALRPETMTPVSTGPSSRIMVRQTNLPVMAMAPNCRQRGRRLQGQHAAGEEAGEKHNGHGTDTDDVGLNEEFRPVPGLAKHIEERAPGEQGVVLHDKHNVLGGSFDRISHHRICRFAGCGGLLLFDRIA